MTYSNYDVCCLDLHIPTYCLLENARCGTSSYGWEYILLGTYDCNTVNVAADNQSSLCSFTYHST